jgi:hypothetical protein
MKTSINTYIAIAALTCFVCLKIHSQTLATTNTPSITYPITDIRDTWGLEETQYYARFLHNQFTLKVDNTIIPEILPASQDPDGNWGKPADGLQLSLRFRHGEYLPNARVEAIIILRNLDLVFRDAGVLGDHDFQYTLHYGTNTLVWKKTPQIVEVVNNSIRPFHLEASTEALEDVWLNRFFDLSKSGKYSLKVQATIPTSDGKGTTNVVSGTATFEIVEKPSPANGLSQTNAPSSNLQK